MRHWNRAEMAAREAERTARQPLATPHPEGVESPAQRAARLRRMADAILASIQEDVRRHKDSPAESPSS